MAEDQHSVNALLKQLNEMMQKQHLFNQEINDIRRELLLLKESENLSEKAEIIPNIIAAAPVLEEEKMLSPPIVIDKANTPLLRIPIQPETETKAANTAETKSKKLIEKSEIEKFIGENLINKIGILILVLGVGIGVKYSIEHKLISPLTRIILGYLLSGGLLGFAIKLKAKYLNFSAALLSGAIAIMYFITFAAHSYYDLIPQLPAFALMLVFTAFAVFAAIKYNLQIIAHFGMVGAYAIPFLLSDGSGKVLILFSYMSIINIGIMLIAFKRYWKALYYSAFVFTWLIFSAWIAAEYDGIIHFELALLFLSVFFIIFYIVFLAYKLHRKEQFGIIDVILLLSNSFLFFAIGYSLLEGHEQGQHFLGLFAVINAIIHFTASLVINKLKLADKNLFHLIAGLVLVFLSMAIPIQLDGNWVTLLWALEAALLFWIGRKFKVWLYEILSYPLMILCLFSLMDDWETVYSVYSLADLESRFNSVLNVHFLSSMLVVGAFSLIYFLNKRKGFSSAFERITWVDQAVKYFSGATLLFIFYLAVRLEIQYYFDQEFEDSAILIQASEEEYSNSINNYALQKFRIIWILNYSLLFFSFLSFLVIHRLKTRITGIISIVFNTLCTLVFLVQGLYVLSMLRDYYIDVQYHEYFLRSNWYIGIRYVSLAFLTMIVLASYHLIRQEFMSKKWRKIFEVALHGIILWVSSSELIHLLDLQGSSGTYKLGLSILWGLYSLLLIALGIWKQRQFLRIWGIALFGITLLKLFLYDLAHLNTLSKTIVFITLGILLLIISFLYNKFQNEISANKAE